MSKKVKKSKSSDANRALGRYLEEIGQYEPLTPEEEIDLAQRVKKGERNACR